MNSKAGLWHLDTAGGLLVKLHTDYRRMEAAPRDPCPAYDFFVTAYHMHEWAARTDAEKQALEAEPLIRVAGVAELAGAALFGGGLGGWIFWRYFRVNKSDFR